MMTIMQIEDLKQRGLHTIVSSAKRRRDASDFFSIHVVYIDSKRSGSSNGALWQTIGGL